MMFLSWKIRGQEISFEKTLLMGILNLTPDSFSDGGKSLEPSKALARAKELESQGADILDLGAESTRPGASAVSADEELRRLLPCLEAIAAEVRLPGSIDTTKPEVAEACLKRGAHIINDVSGLRDSGEAMARLVRDFGAGIILMHRRGNPKTMQGLASYGDTAGEILAELSESMAFAEKCGILPEQIVLDPGLGFAKNTEQNLEILQQLERFYSLGRPVLLGPSRKSFIGTWTGREPQDREFGTAAVCAYAVLKGVHLLRVHEAGMMRDAVRVAEVLRGEKHVRA